MKLAEIAQTPHFQGAVDNAISQAGGSPMWQPIVGETTTYPPCQRGRDDQNRAHDFTDAEDRASAQVYIYCRQCGLVQKLEELP
jgi:hypothetical protein